MPAPRTTIPTHLDLLLTPMPHRPGWAALVLANDFKMRAHLVHYGPTDTTTDTAAAPGRHRIHTLADLTDPLLRTAAEHLLRLWNSRPDNGDEHDWEREIHHYNRRALTAAAGAPAPAIDALEQITAGTARFSDGDGYAPTLSITGGGHLLAALGRWLDDGPTPHTVLIDTDRADRTVSAQVFAESVGDLLAWALHATGTHTHTHTHTRPAHQREHDYVVTWQTQITATDPHRAARRARTVQRDPSSTATVFHVTGPDGRHTHVDLADDDPAPPRA
ncbi:hypothetical protein [Kitasatospora azatica]|uniref:hypothetical protein n=1 Tax=Kitasatospora azatica TaxID=58347 RepID=UPI000569BD2F|nr:hypothetical protein [Kitasatospora azatica]